MAEPSEAALYQLLLLSHQLAALVDEMQHWAAQDRPIRIKWQPVGCFHPSPSVPEA